MSRNIPLCRTWLVTFYDDDGKIVYRVTTIAPNKRFARWNANEEITGHFRLSPVDAARVTIGLARKPNMCRR